MRIVRLVVKLLQSTTSQRPDAARSFGARLTAAFALGVAVFFLTLLVAEQGIGRIVTEARLAHQRTVPLLASTSQIVRQVSELLDDTNALELSRSEAELERRSAEVLPRFQVPREALAALTDKVADPGSLEDLAGLLFTLETRAREQAILHEQRLRLAAELDDAVAGGTLAATRLDDLLGLEFTRSWAVGGLAPEEQLLYLEMQHAAASIATLLGSMERANGSEDVVRIRSILQVEATAVAGRMAELPANGDRRRMGVLLTEILDAISGPQSVSEAALAALVLQDRLGTARSASMQLQGQLRAAARVVESEAQTQLKNSVARMDAVTSQVRRTVRLLFAAALLGSVLVLVFYVRGNLIRRVERLSSDIERLSAGDLEVEVTVEGRDELTRIARATDVFRENALQLRRTQQELLDRNEELNQFAYVASHDLKSPLRAIDNLTTFLEEDAAEHLDQESRTHITMMRERVQKMERLLEDLLQYSRLGRTPELIEEIDLRALLEEHLRWRPPAEGYSVQVEGGARLRSYRPPLELVVRNLLDNAVLHHDRESGSILVRIEQDGDGAVLTIADDGPGIPLEHREHAFTMLRRLSSKGEGTGMGLALVRKAAESVGGAVDIAGGEGRGATFIVRWPGEAAASPSSSGSTSP